MCLNACGQHFLIPYMLMPGTRLVIPDLQPHQSPATRRNAIATLGGAFMVLVGVALPWLTLFAGLKAYTGLAGRHGQLLLAGGVVAALCALVTLARPFPAFRLISAVLGASLVGFSSWLLVGVISLAKREASNPMMLAHVGPGLFVVAAGALVIAISPLLTTRGEATSIVQRGMP